MNDFVSTILNGDLSELLDEDLYQSTIAAVAASWAILAFGGVVQIFSNLLAVLLNLRAGRKL